ncbi:MAG TPA: hypothetical protein VFH66_06775 [Mycobacteriales bacterium]|nr:hypothetical protein [Mycobacteriales bacterium]
MSDRLDHAAFVGAAIAGGGVLAGLLDWATRPPCPENYVRLIDVVPIAAVVCAALALVLTWRAVRTMPWAPRRKEVRGVTVVLSALLTAVSVLPALVAVASLVQHSDESVDSSCWTF